MIDFKKLNSNLMINMMKRLILTSEGLSDSLDEVTETDLERGGWRLHTWRCQIA